MINEEQKTGDGRVGCSAWLGGDPVTMNETWCDPQCPNLRAPVACGSLDATCAMLGVNLDYYDYFLAACKYDSPPNDKLTRDAGAQNL